MGITKQYTIVGMECRCVIELIWTHTHTHFFPRFLEIKLEIEVITNMHASTSCINTCKRHMYYRETTQHANCCKTLSMSMATAPPTAKKLYLIIGNNCILSYIFSRSTHHHQQRHLPSAHHPTDRRRRRQQAVTGRCQRLCHVLFIVVVVAAFLFFLLFFLLSHFVSQWICPTRTRRTRCCCCLSLSANIHHSALTHHTVAPRWARAHTMRRSRCQWG